VRHDSIRELKIIRAFALETGVDETLCKVYLSSMTQPFTSTGEDGPVYDWTVRIGSGSYGVTSWVPGHWDMYLGSYVEPRVSVGVQYATVVLPTLLLAFASCKIAISMLRAAARWSRAYRGTAEGA